MTKQENRQAGSTVLFVNIDNLSDHNWLNLITRRRAKRKWLLWLPSYFHLQVSPSKQIYLDDAGETRCLI